MDDLEICKRIAEIEGIPIYREDNFFYGDGYFRVDTFAGLAPMMYNPLTDDALCFQLMVNYKVSVFYEHGYAAIVDDDSGEYVGDASLYEAPNKAILLAIIEAHNASN